MVAHVAAFHIARFPVTFDRAAAAFDSFFNADFLAVFERLLFPLTPEFAFVGRLSVWALAITSNRIGRKFRSPKSYWIRVV